MRNRLRVLRAQYRLSQADVAEHLGVARQTIHAIENGKFSPSLTLGFKIASLFGADINDVFSPDPDEIVASISETDHDFVPLPRADDGVLRARPLSFFGKPRANGDG